MGIPSCLNVVGVDFHMQVFARPGASALPVASVCRSNKTNATGPIFTHFVLEALFYTMHDSAILFLIPKCRILFSVCEILVIHISAAYGSPSRKTWHNIVAKKAPTSHILCIQDISSTVWVFFHGLNEEKSPMLYYLTLILRKRHAFVISSARVSATPHTGIG